MPASKSCPTCREEWAATFKFCPKDGALLVELGRSRPAVTQDSKTLLVTPAAAAPLRSPAQPQAPQAQRSPLAALDAAVVRAGATQPKPRKAEPRLFNLAPAPAERPPAERPPVDAPLTSRPASAPADHAPATPEVSRVGPRRRGRFSETAWFMRPDQPVDPETGRVRADPRAYVRDDSIPEEKRRRFSLRRKDEE